MAMRMGSLCQALLSAAPSEAVAREAAEEAATLHLGQLRVHTEREACAPYAARKVGILEILRAVNVIGHAVAIALVWSLMLR